MSSQPIPFNQDSVSEKTSETTQTKLHEVVDEIKSQNLENTDKKLTKKERKALKKKQKKALKKAYRAKLKKKREKLQELFKKKSENKQNSTTTKNPDSVANQDSVENPDNVVKQDNVENPNNLKNQDNVVNQTRPEKDSKDGDDGEDEDDPGIPLYDFLIPEKELDNTMFVYNQKQKLVDLKLYKVTPSKKYANFLEFRCLHKDNIPGWIYLEGFEKKQQILVNQNTVDLIRAQEVTDKTDEEIAKLFIKYYGDSSDVVLSLMGFDPIKMKKERSDKRNTKPNIANMTQTDITTDENIRKLREIHTEKNKEFDKKMKSMRET